MKLSTLGCTMGAQLYPLCLRRDSVHPSRETGILLPSNQLQHRTSHGPKDVLPLHMWRLLCFVSTAHPPRHTWGLRVVRAVYQPSTINPQP